MSNLYRTGLVVQENSVRVINSNDRLEKKIQNRQREQEKEISDVFEFKNFDEDGFEEVVTASSEDPSQEELEAPKERRKKHKPIRSNRRHQELMDDILEAARLEADTIVLDARNNVEQIKEEAKQSGYEEGFAKGFDAGNQKGYEESYENGMQRIKAEEERISQREHTVKNEEFNLQNAKKNFEVEYERKFKQMEPEIVKVLADVFDRVFDTQFGDKQDILLHLLKKSLNKIENSKEFLIKVSREDYEYIMEHKQEVEECVGRNVELNIMEDPSLTKKQCVIETDGGVFDCSLDVELKNLIKDLKSLSI